MMCEEVDYVNEYVGDVYWVEDLINECFGELFLNLMMCLMCSFNVDVVG